MGSSFGSGVLCNYLALIICCPIVLSRPAPFPPANLTGSFQEKLDDFYFLTRLFNFGLAIVRQKVLWMAVTLAFFMVSILHLSVSLSTCLTVNRIMIIQFVLTRTNSYTPC